MDRIIPERITRAYLETAMRGCFQAKGMDMMQHGELVHDWFADLHQHLTTGRPLQLEWRLPDWIQDPRLIEGLLPFETLRTYQVWHDCGKPFCRTVDDAGRQHFPGHAEMSARLWRAAGGTEQEARLMAMDMDIHTLSGDGVPEFAARPEAASLILTGLAEVHANASLFGGTSSDSFKIKLKHISRRGKQILAAMPPAGRAMGDAA